jgi:virulence-associated protein VapD
MPPVSKDDSARARARASDRIQPQRTVKIRKQLQISLDLVFETYWNAVCDLEKFIDNLGFEVMQASYSVSANEVRDSVETKKKIGPEEAQQATTIRSLHQLCQDIRKLLLLKVLCVQGGTSDYHGFTKAMDALRDCNRATRRAIKCVSDGLTAVDDGVYMAISLVEETRLTSTVWPDLKTPDTPRSPRFDHWKHQIRRIGSMNGNIKSLEAKMAVLVEESSRTLSDDSTDLSDLGKVFSEQYESIGRDLRSLMESWETGRKSLQRGIAENRRKSTMSARVSSRSSGSGPGTFSDDAEENGTPADALRALEGDSSPPVNGVTTPPTAPDTPSPTEERTYEAIGGPEPRPRSTLSRDERIKKMREGRDAREAARQEARKNRYVIDELKGKLKSQELLQRIERTRSVGLQAPRNSSMGRISLPVIAQTPPSPSPST